jgi:hypothetical protein
VVSFVRDYDLNSSAGNPRQHFDTPSPVVVEARAIDDLAGTQTLNRVAKGEPARPQTLLEVRMIKNNVARVSR